MNRLCLSLSQNRDLPRCLRAESPCLREHFVQLATGGVRIDARLANLTDNRDALRRGLIHKNRHVRVSHESAIRKPLFDQSLGLFLRQSVHVHVVDQGQVNVARIADSRLAGQFRHVVNVNFDQVSDPKLGRR